MSTKHLKHDAKPVSHDTHYLEVVQKKLIKTSLAHVYELTPQYLATTPVFHCQHAEPLAPVGGIHQDNNIFVAGNNPCRTF